MSNERAEAAVSAVQNETYGAEYSRDLACIALAAADAVMFSEASIERAAKAVHDLGATALSWDERDEELRELYREDARAVVAALKGGTE